MRTFTSAEFLEANCSLRLILIECSPHYFGSDCNTPCGHCKENDVCNNVTGRCPNGCQNQWTKLTCDGK